MPKPNPWSMRLTILLLSLSGCATAPSESTNVTAVCPVLVDYTHAQQDAVADALDALPLTSPLRGWIQDYIGLRDQVRACRGK